MSLVPPKTPGEEDLEELGDEVIIAQQSVAHAPPAAAHLAQEKRSVVISDKPPGDAGKPGSARPKSRGRGDATVVIRDRKKLEAMRREIRESQRAYARRSSRPPRPYLVWGGAALAAFVLGGAVALAVGAVTSRTPELAPSSLPVDPAAAARDKAAKGTPEPTAAPTVNLEDLPVERRKR